MKINDMNYYVAVSSFKIKQEANILICVDNDKQKVKGSLRFNYMFPVPDKRASKIVIKNVEDIKYWLLLNKEYRFCIANADIIKKKSE